MTEKLTVWYDGACPLCRREINLMRRLDRRDAIRFIDVAAEDAGESCPIERADLLARFHAQEAGRPIVSGAAAFAAMWRAVPMLAPLGHLARFPPVLWLGEAAYRLFLKVRPAISRSLARHDEKRRQAGSPAAE